MNMKKLLLLINPVSGKQLLNECLMEIVDIFSAAGFDTTIHLTESSEDMEKYAAEGGGVYDRIVCCGGDGTLNIVAGALYRCGGQSVIGYIPGGTTNDFAFSRRIDTYAVGAARQIADGVERPVDLGLLEGKPFVYVAAFGMFANASYQTSREQKQNFGHAAYVFEGIKSFISAKTFHASFKCAAAEVEGDFIYGMVSNSRRVGGFEMPIMQNTLYDDGEMEVVLVRQPKNPSDMQKLVNALVTQNADDTLLYMFKTDRLEYTSDTAIPWSLDGEFGGEYTNAVIKVEEAAVKMVF